MSTDNTQHIFQKLSLIDVSKGIETRKSGTTELSYLSWSYAWGEVKQAYPDANYKVKEYDNKPYLFDENLGYLVSTEVTINGETIAMHLPVMDGANKAMKNTAYTYDVAEWKWDPAQNKKVKAGTIKKTVEQATMFDINTTIMRCLVKNIAMFGLGLSLYYGEDLPSVKELKDEIKKEEQVLTFAKGALSKLQNNEEIDLSKLQTWLKANESQIDSELLAQINLEINNQIK